MSEERAVHTLRAQAPAPLARGWAGGLALGLCACAFVGALAAAGVSSRVGSPPTGGLSTLEAIALVVLGSLAVLGVFALLVARGVDERRFEKAQVPLWKRILVLITVTVLCVGGFALLVRVLPVRQIHLHVAGGSAPARAGKKHQPPPVGRGPFDSSRARVAAFAVGGTIGIVGLFLLYRRPGLRPRVEEDPDARLDRAIAAGIQELETEPDPRRAVIRAYAGMEHALAADGLPREAPETPLEYLERVLEHVQASKGATAALTGLYEQAKFSSHAIDEPMRREALAALTDLRSELDP